MIKNKDLTDQEIKEFSYLFDGHYEEDEVDIDFAFADYNIYGD